MAKSIQKRWGYSNNKAIQRRAHSGGKKDEAKACKILWWKNNISKLYVGWVIVKLTWLDYVQPVICKSHDNDIIIAFPLKRELRQTCRYEYSLIKNLPTYWGTGEENRETNENILAL